MGMKSDPEARILRPMLQEMGDFPKTAQPTPVVENVLKRVQYLEEQGIFLPQRVKAQALPRAAYLSIQDTLRNLQSNVERLVNPQPFVQFHFSGKGCGVQALRHLPGIGIACGLCEGKVMCGYF